MGDWVKNTSTELQINDIIVFNFSEETFSVKRTGLTHGLLDKEMESNFKITGISDEIAAEIARDYGLHVKKLDGNKNSAHYKVVTH